MSASHDVSETRLRALAFHRYVGSKYAAVRRNGAKGMEKLEQGCVHYLCFDFDDAASKDSMRSVAGSGLVAVAAMLGIPLKSSTYLRT